MYRVDRNNFYNQAKIATVQTPASVSEFIFEIIHSKIDSKKPVIDPCVGGVSSKTISRCRI